MGRNGFVFDKTTLLFPFGRATSFEGERSPAFSHADEKLPAERQIDRRQPALIAPYRQPDAGQQT